MRFHHVWRRDRTLDLARAVRFSSSQELWRHAQHCGYEVQPFAHPKCSSTNLCTESKGRCEHLLQVSGAAAICVTERLWRKSFTVETLPIPNDAHLQSRGDSTGGGAWDFPPVRYLENVQSTCTSDTLGLWFVSTEYITQISRGWRRPDHGGELLSVVIDGGVPCTMNSLDCTVSSRNTCGHSGLILLLERIFERVDRSSMSRCVVLRERGGGEVGSTLKAATMKFKPRSRWSPSSILLMLIRTNLNRALWWRGYTPMPVCLSALVYAFARMCLSVHSAHFSHLSNFSRQTCSTLRGGATPRKTCSHRWWLCKPCRFESVPSTCLGDYASFSVRNVPNTRLSKFISSAELCERCTLIESWTISPSSRPQVWDTVVEMRTTVVSPRWVKSSRASGSHASWNSFWRKLTASALAQIVSCCDLKGRQNIKKIKGKKGKIDKTQKTKSKNSIKTKNKSNFFFFEKKTKKGKTKDEASSSFFLPLLSETARTIVFFGKEMLQEIVKQLRPKSTRVKKKKKKKKENKTLNPEGRTPPFRRLTCLQSPGCAEEAIVQSTLHVPRHWILRQAEFERMELSIGECWGKYGSVSRCLCGCLLALEWYASTMGLGTLSGFGSSLLESTQSDKHKVTVSLSRVVTVPVAFPCWRNTFVDEAAERPGNKGEQQHVEVGGGGGSLGRIHHHHHRLQPRCFSGRRHTGARDFCLSPPTHPTVDRILLGAVGFCECW